MNGPKSYPNPVLHRWNLPGEIQKPSLYYRLMRRGCQIVATLLLQPRVFDRHNEPADGGVVYIANHQSFLDPILATMALRRPGNYMARESLFRNPLFRRLIESVNAFPIRRGQADIGALKEAMRRLRNGRQIVVFPEGTRTCDGRIGPFLPGVAVLSQRAADWTVPVLIDGAFEAWPRSRAYPGFGKVYVQYGKAIPRSEARKYKPAEFVSHVRETLIDMQTELRRRFGREKLIYDD